MQTVIQFAPDGAGRCLHTDAIDLAQLGRLSMRRASTVEFNDERQQWEARTPNGALIHKSASRAACLAAERKHFNRQLLEV